MNFFLLIWLLKPVRFWFWFVFVLMMSSLSDIHILEQLSFGTQIFAINNWCQLETVQNVRLIFYCKTTSFQFDINSVHFLWNFEFLFWTIQLNFVRKHTIFYWISSIKNLKNRHQKSFASSCNDGPRRDVLGLRHFKKLHFLTSKTRLFSKDSWDGLLLLLLSTKCNQIFISNLQFFSISKDEI